MTSVRYGRARKRVKVAHRMTPYDYALRSIIITGEKGEKHNILEGEALFENVLSRSKYMASQRHVHSDIGLVNGGPIDSTNVGKALENLRFAGFAVTGFDQKYGVYEQGFMATIGGVNTVMNTGDGMINTGQVVYVLPLTTDKQLHPSIKGVVRSKRLAATVTETSAEFQKLITAPSGGSALTTKEYLQKFAVGTCIRGGRSGQPIDIVLHANANIILQN